MKKIFLFATAALTSLYACAQTAPKPVADAFAKKFAAATEVKWEQEGQEWEAEFKSNGAEMSASYDAAGKWLETETELKKSELPAELFKAVMLKFKGWDIEEVVKLDSPDFKGFELQLEKSNTTIEITATNGNDIVIKEVMVKEKEGKKKEDGKKGKKKNDKEDEKD